MSEDRVPAIPASCMGCDWPRSSKAVLDALDAHTKTLTALQDQVISVRLDIAELKTSARIWGSIWGTISGVGAALAVKFLGK